jgi:hypothetical protein
MPLPLLLPLPQNSHSFSYRNAEMISRLTSVGRRYKIFGTLLAPVPAPVPVPVPVPAPIPAPAPAPVAAGRANADAAHSAYR